MSMSLFHACNVRDKIQLECCSAADRKCRCGPMDGSQLIFVCSVELVTEASLIQSREMHRTWRNGLLHPPLYNLCM